MRLGSLTGRIDPTADENPRGFLVQVALDDLEDPGVSTDAILNDFEEHGVWVKG